MNKTLRLACIAAVMALASNCHAETLTICYNYGCATQADVDFPDPVIAAVTNEFAGVDSAESERHVLREAIGHLYAWAASQTPIGADRGGNYADQGAIGAMDCIDHSTTTTRFLDLLSRSGALRYHQVMPPEVRGLFFQHFSAQIIELDEPRVLGLQHADHEPSFTAQSPRYAVDSWYVDNGQPALVLPIDDWRVDKVTYD